jgi:hypothetical protein
MGGLNRALRQKWVAAGYPGDVGSAAVIPPPPPDFIPVYHFTSANFAMSDTALGRLKVARFSDLNDPFELMALNLREASARRLVKDFKTTFDRDTGLLCFSSDWKGQFCGATTAQTTSAYVLGSIFADRWGNPFTMRTSDSSSNFPTRAQSLPRFSKDCSAQSIVIGNTNEKFVCSCH